MAISDDQRRDFEQRGWFHAGPLFDDGELDEIRREYDRILQRPMKLQEAGKSPFEYSPLLQLQSETLCAYATSPKLVEIAIDLIGPDLRLYWDQAVCKPAGADSDVPWHQDNGYTPVTPEQYATFTVALDATSEENGCLWIQPGSHREGVKSHAKTDMVFYRGYEGDESGVPVAQPEGDVLVFSSLTMHRSGPNRSTSPRRSGVIQFCDAATVQKKSGKVFDDRLLVARDGVPLAVPIRERDFDFSELIRAAQDGS